MKAYALLGCTDEGLRNELLDMKDSGREIEGLGFYGGTSLKSANTSLILQFTVQN